MKNKIKESSVTFTLSNGKKYCIIVDSVSKAKGLLRKGGITGNIVKVEVQ